MGAPIQLRPTEQRPALAFTAALAGCHDQAELSTRTGELTDLVGCESVMVSICRGWASEIELELGDPDLYPAQMLEVVEQAWRDHPVLPRDLARASAGVRRLSDFVPPRDWRRRRLFNDFYRPLGMTRELSTQLAWGPAGWSCCLTLHRAGRDFSERQRLLLELVTPHLRAARLRLAAERLAARRLELLERGVDEAASGALLLDREGALEAVSPGARRLLRRWFRQVAGEPPAELAEWWQAASRGEGPLSRTLRSNGAELRLRLLSGADEHLVIIDEHEFDPSPSSLAACLPVTRREADVLALLAAGLTNDGIAHDLGISRHTVVRHVERIYKKLAVSTRVAATRAALDATRDLS